MANSTGCVGCDFVKQFTPHDGGWCQVHGDIPPIDGLKKHLHLAHGVAAHSSAAQGKTDIINEYLAAKKEKEHDK